MAGRGQPDGYVRETFSLPRGPGPRQGKGLLRSYPKAAYMSEVEGWRELPDGANSPCAAQDRGLMAAESDKLVPERAVEVRATWKLFRDQCLTSGAWIWLRMGVSGLESATFISAKFRARWSGLSFYIICRCGLVPCRDAQTDPPRG
jgi:hypothetical protein